MLNRRELRDAGRGSGACPAWRHALRWPRDFGFKIMMTPKWTGFPLFRADWRRARRRPPRNLAIR